MPTVVIGYCPVPKCEHKDFRGETSMAVKALVKEHIKANLEDPNHSDIAEIEGWLEPISDPLGD